MATAISGCGGVWLGWGTAAAWRQGTVQEPIVQVFCRYFAGILQVKLRQWVCGVGILLCVWGAGERAVVRGALRRARAACSVIPHAPMRARGRACPCAVEKFGDACFEGAQSKVSCSWCTKDVSSLSQYGDGGLIGLDETWS
jgi:hypothetical protein